MLEFIVLGQIPGTRFVVTFSWVVAAATILAGYSLLKHEHQQRSVAQQVTIEERAL